MRCNDAEPRNARRPRSAVACKLFVTATVALFAANCSSQQKVASNARTLDPKYGVYASPRVIEDGQPVPKGGGREMVGKPYQVAGRTYVPRNNPSYSRVGLASWYGSDFHGRLTANGEIFDRESLAAAHPTMPLPSYARVTNLENRRSMIVRVNDRGPYHADRVMDVSENVAEALAFRRAGTARVKVDYVGRASVRGSNDNKLMATLRTDGAPAAHPGATAPVMVASAEPARPRAQTLGLVEPRRETRVAVAQTKTDSDDDAEVAAEDEPTRAPAARLAVSPAISLLPRDDGPRSGRILATTPPERPVDLATVPNAGRPVPLAPVRQLPPRRPVMAGML